MNQQSRIVLSLVAVCIFAASPAVCAQEIKALRVETVATGIDAGTGGVAVDTDGNIYTADFGKSLGDPRTAGKKIYKIKPDQSVSLFAEGLDGASGNCFDSKGNLFQSNIRGNYVSLIKRDGTKDVFSREGLMNPVGIIIDSDDTLYVANCGSASIRKISKDKKSTLFVQDKMLKCPNGIAMDGDGNLYVANFMNGDVVKISADGKDVSKLATLPGSNNGHLVYHKETDSLFVVARSAHQIYHVSLDGKATVIAGSGERGAQDGEPLEATFSLPNDINVSPDGKHLYVNEVAPIEGSKMILAPTRVRRIVLKN